jgi:hypothetical protein
LLSTISISSDIVRIVSDHEGDVIAVWSKNPSGFDIDLYAQQISRNGVLGTLTDVAEEGHPIPSRFALSQNFPNPFNPTTEITFTLPGLSSVTLKVFDLLGRETETLASGAYGPGVHSVRWDATGKSSGIYFYRLETEGFVGKKRMILIR